MFEEGLLELGCHMAIQRHMEGGTSQLPKCDRTPLVGGSMEKEGWMPCSSRHPEFHSMFWFVLGDPQDDFSHHIEAS